MLHSHEIPPPSAVLALYNAIAVTKDDDDLKAAIALAKESVQPHRVNWDFDLDKALPTLVPEVPTEPQSSPRDEGGPVLQTLPRDDSPAKRSGSPVKRSDSPTGKQSEKVDPKRESSPGLLPRMRSSTDKMRDPTLEHNRIKVRASGERSKSPPRERPSREPSPRDRSPQNPSPRDRSPQKSSPRELPLKESSPRTPSPREPSPRKQSPREQHPLKPSSPRNRPPNETVIGTPKVKPSKAESEIAIKSVSISSAVPLKLGAISAQRLLENELSIANEMPVHKVRPAAAGLSSSDADKGQSSSDLVKTEPRGVSRRSQERRQRKTLSEASVSPGDPHGKASARNALPKSSSSSNETLPSTTGASKGSFVIASSKSDPQDTQTIQQDGQRPPRRESDPARSKARLITSLPNSHTPESTAPKKTKAIAPAKRNCSSLGEPTGSLISSGGSPRDGARSCTPSPGSSPRGRLPEAKVTWTEKEKGGEKAPLRKKAPLKRLQLAAIFRQGDGRNKESPRQPDSQDTESESEPESESDSGVGEFTSTLLLLALREGTVEHVEALLNAGAEMHPHVLHDLIIHRPANMLAKMELVLKRGAAPFVNSADDEGKSPLHHLLLQVAQTPFATIATLEFMISAGASANWKDRRGITALQQFLGDFYDLPQAVPIFRRLIYTVDPTRAFANGSTIEGLLAAPQPYVPGMSKKHAEAMALLDDATRKFSSAVKSRDQAYLSRFRGLQAPSY